MIEQVFPLSRADPGALQDAIAFTDHSVFGGGQRDLLAALSASCREDPLDAWNAVSRTACAACAASAGGVVIEGAYRQPGVAGDAARLEENICFTLTGLLRQSPKCVSWADASGVHYAAAAIGPDPATGFIWVRRDHEDFVWIEALHLRALSNFAALLHSLEQRIEEGELLLQEHRHRCGNDLQMVNSVLAFQARQTTDEKVREALESAASRVSALAAARREAPAALPSMLQRFCAALAAQVEQRGIIVHVAIDGEPCALNDRQTSLLLITANELVTNAIKHAFPDDRRGMIDVKLQYAPAMLRLMVSDDGVALPPTAQMLRGGSGFDLVSRLLAGARGKLGVPIDRTKTFVVQMPLH